MNERHLAASPDFSPGIVGDLQALLALVADHAGATRDFLVEAVRDRYFAASASQYEEAVDRKRQQAKRAANVLIGLREYGLVDDDLRLTSVGDEIRSMSAGDAAHRLASHILIELQGIDVLRAVRDLQQQDRTVGKDSLAEQLRVHGFAMPRDTTKHLTMLNWLRPAGVFRSAGYEIDGARVQHLAGVALDDVEAWQAMPLPQQAFIQALKRLSNLEGPGPFPTKRVLDQAEIEHGTLYQGGQTRKSIIEPLEQGGWITSAGQSAGRGAKSGSVAPASRLTQLDLDLLRGFHVPPVPADLRAHMNKPLTQIAADLQSTDTFVAGVALELLALRMAVALGLTPAQLRKRDDKTGGGEVDLIAEGVHLHHSRWLFQCKNQRAAVGVSALAKEVGMAVLLRAHVIVLATTSRFSSSVVDHARQVAETTHMQVVLVDAPVLKAYLRSGDAALQKHFRSVAGRTLVQKRHQAVMKA